MHLKEGILDIQWLGHSCFRIRTRDASILVDPYPKDLGYAMGRVSASIMLVTHAHPNHSYTSAVAGDPFLIEGPGEYEVSGVFVTGIPTFHDAESGKRRGRNTVYIMEAEDMTLVHLGDLGHVLTSAQVEQMHEVDILFAPVGGKTTITSTQAAEVVSLLEPRVVVPMHYRTGAAGLDLDPVDRFLREMGAKKPQELPKLTVNRGSLPSETQVVLLDYPRH